jgi:integrase
MPARRDARHTVQEGTRFTKMARQISLAGGSIRDIQAIASHASLQTTERYLSLSPEAQSNVIAMLDKAIR